MKVVLDGSTATLPWPLELAEDLLADASAWGPAVTGPDNSRYADEWLLAVCAKWRSRGEHPANDASADTPSLHLHPDDASTIILEALQARLRRSP